MKRINRKSAMAVYVAASALSLVGSSASAQAIDGTWAAFQSGSWSDTSKWVNNILPDNGGTANIVVDNNVTSGATLTLDSSRTVQNLVFGNVTAFGNGPSVGTMNLAGTAGAVLTLADTTDVTPVTPTIIVPSMGIQTIDPGVKTVTITASLAGSQGVNLKFGSFVGDTYTINGMGSGQYTSNHVNTVTLSGSDSFTGGVLTADGVGSVNLGNANVLNGLAGFTFDNLNGNTGSSVNNLYFLNNAATGNNIGTNVPMTLLTGTGDHRVTVNNQSGFTTTYMGNVTVTGSAPVTFTENGTNGQLIFNGSLDGTGLSNTSFVIRGTNTTATRTFGEINGDINFPTSSATALLAKTDPGLWILNTPDAAGINAYRLQVSAGTLRVTNATALSSNTAVVLGQRSGTSDVAIFESNGTITSTLGSGGGQISSIGPMGLSAGGGNLNVDFNGGGQVQFAAYNGSDTSYANVTGTAPAASAGSAVITLPVDPTTLNVQVGDYAFMNGSSATASPFKITGIDVAGPDTVSVDLPIASALTGSVRFFSPSKFNDTSMFLNSVYATNNLTVQNDLDLNGTNRTMIVYAKQATLSGNISNSSLSSPAGLIKANTNTPGSSGVGTFGTGALELTGSNTFDGGVSVKIGSLLVGNDYALGTGTLNVTAQNAGAANTATQAFAGSVQLESTLNNTAVVAGGITMSQLATDTTGAAHTATLAPTIDLGGSNMVLNYTGSSPIATIQGYIHSGWIKTSTAGEVVGYGEATTLYPSGGSFYNVALDGVTPALLLKTTFAGDANLDGTVNALDFNALATNYGGSAANGQYWTAGDFNNDGTVDSSDFALLAANYGEVLPSSSAPAAVLGALVPEPIGISLLGMMGMLGLRRRVHCRTHSR